MALVFTSLEPAQDQLNSLSQDDLAIAAIPSPGDFRQFLQMALAGKHGHVVFDLNPKDDRGHVFSVKAILEQIAGQSS